MTATATVVRERPILFSGPMVRAILAGNKTQTRRVYRPAKGFPCWDGEQYPDGSGSQWMDMGPCPFGAPGDLLWVRETWAAHGPMVVWRADHPTLDRPVIAPRWRPSIHMPKWAARIWLRVTDVRVERVGDISDADAIAEGVGPFANSLTIDCATTRPRDVFAALWDSLNADRGYDFFGANPWVWVVSFERTESAR